MTKGRVEWTEGWRALTALAVLAVMAVMAAGCRSTEREMVVTQQVDPAWVLPDPAAGIRLEDVTPPVGEYAWAGKEVTDAVAEVLSRQVPRVTWTRERGTGDKAGVRLAGTIVDLRVTSSERLEKIRRYQDGDLLRSYEVQVPLLSRQAELKMVWRMIRGEGEVLHQLPWEGNTSNQEEELRREQRVRMAQLTGEQAGFSGLGGRSAAPLPTEEELVTQLAVRCAAELSAKLAGETRQGRLRFRTKEDLLFDKAFYYLERDDVPSAASWWDTAVRQGDATGYAQHNLGLLLEWQRDWPGALARFRLAYNLADADFAPDCAGDIARIEGKIAGKIAPEIFP